MKVSVLRDAVPERVTQWLAALPVQDLAIEDVEIEAVIRGLFSPNAANLSTLMP